MDETGVRLFQSQLKALQRRSRQESVSVAGLTRSSVRVLGAVARSPDGCQPSQIADDLLMTSSNVAAALRELAGQRLVERHRDEADSRRVNVLLTEAGSKVVEQSRAGRESWLSAAINTLLDPDEQATLVAAGHLLERLSRFGSVPDQYGTYGASGE